MYFPGEQGLTGPLSSCSTGLLAFPTPFTGQGQGPLQEQPSGLSPGQVPGQSHGQSALEGFQRLDSLAQIAVLQRLTAAKADAADNKWLQARVQQLSYITCCVCMNHPDCIQHSQLVCELFWLPWHSSDAHGVALALDFDVLAAVKR